MGENFYGDVIFSTTPHTLTRGFTKGSRKIAKKKREMLSWKRAKTRKIRKVPGAPPHCTSASVFQTTSILFFLHLMKISLQLHTLFLNSWVRTFAKIENKNLTSNLTQNRVQPPKTSPIEQISYRWEPKFSPLQRVTLQSLKSCYCWSILLKESVSNLAPASAQNQPKIWKYARKLLIFSLYFLTF